MINNKMGTKALKPGNRDQNGDTQDERRTHDQTMPPRLVGQAGPERRADHGDERGQAGQDADLRAAESQALIVEHQERRDKRHGGKDQKVEGKRPGFVHARTAEVCRVTG